jgi:hypothetical protein
MTGEEHVYFIGQGGEIYLFITSLDQLYLVAGCGRTLFERLALYHQKVGKRFFEAHICRNVADRIADRLGVPRLDCASDDYFTVWANDSVQIRLVQDSGPNIFGTHLAIVDPEQFLGAMSALRSEESGVELVLWGGANNIDDAGGLALLERAGIKADVRFGPGPGNYDFTIDPDTGEAVYIASSYDSTDWT